MNLITDRTASDVSRAKALRAKGWSSMTEEEQAKYLSGLKGAYNYTDLNRVEYATQFINEYLNGLQDVLDNYRAERDVASSSVWVVPYLPLDLTHKVDWSMDDLPTEEDLARYLSNVEKVSGQFPITRNLPASMDGLSYEAANEIEKALEEEYKTGLAYEIDIKQLIDNTAAVYVYSGEVYGGELV